MDKELYSIYEGFTSSLSPSPPTNSQKQAWLDFLSQKEIATVPVSFQAIETPNGKSYGANVTFAGIMNEAKKIHEGLKGEGSLKETVSSRLQDYAIGLHEDKKIINQSQTSELVAMFQDEGSIEYFLDNYKTIDSPKENQEKPKPLKIKPSIGPEVFVIQGGGAPTYDGKGGQNGLKNLRELFDKTLDISIARSTEIVKNASEVFGRSEKGRNTLKALEKDEKFLSMFDRNNYEGIWNKLTETYNINTQFSQKNMSENQTKGINEVFSNLVLDLQIRCSDHIMNKMEKTTGEKKPKVFDYSGPEM